MEILSMDASSDEATKGGSAVASLRFSMGHCFLFISTKIPTKEVYKHYHALQSIMIDRRNPDSPVRPLMLSKKVHAILHTGVTVNMLVATGIRKKDLPHAKDIKQVVPRELTLEAKWLDKSKEQAQCGGDASVFGNLGVLAISKDVRFVDIPKMNALAVPKSFLKKYGAELIALHQSFKLDDVAHEELKSLFLVEYIWDQEYIEEYALNPRGGGGVFVETHPFPHVFIPLSPKCGGALILGIDRSDGYFDFASFEIPFGYTMKVGSNVIHSDAFFVGPYAISLTQTDRANSVLLKRDTVAREIERVCLTPVPK
ncbi:TPA: hypothetical protein ACTUN8_000032 [Legionella anisa]